MDNKGGRPSGADEGSRDFNIQLGQRIRETRQRMDLTQQDAAAQAGLALSSWQNWEAGRKGMHVFTFAKVCEVLKVSPSALLFGREEEPNLDILGVTLTDEELAGAQVLLKKLLAYIEDARRKSE